jgi:hypothetical protein
MFDRGYDLRAFKKDLGAFERRHDIRLSSAQWPAPPSWAVSSRARVAPSCSEGRQYTIFSFRLARHASAGRARRGSLPPGRRRKDHRPCRPNAGHSSLPAKEHVPVQERRPHAPHFVLLQQVAEGTTTDQVLEALQSEEQGPPPSFILPAHLETGSLSPGRKMTVNYDLPPGQYVVLCFFPDPNMKGMPHAFMGMVKMIHLM